MVRSSGHLPVAIADQGVIDGEKIRAVSYIEPDDPNSWDSGYALWSTPPEEVEEDENGQLICPSTVWCSTTPMSGMRWTSHGSTASRSTKDTGA